MRIFIDIGHPAHVHYFKNLIKIMEAKGHEFFISARDKEVTHHLLTTYNISYYNRKKGSANLIGKLLYMIITDFKLLVKAKRFHPDLFLSFASPYVAHVAVLLNKPHLALTDTESARLGILSFAPFTSLILTPAVFKKQFGKKHIRFDSFMELTYLHEKYFNPENISELQNKYRPYVLLRFVSWEANHDIHQKGFNEMEKREIIETIINNNFDVYISSEKKLPEDLAKYNINLSPEKIHSLIFHSRLYIGEGATMASESVMLGVPAIYVNTLKSGTIEAQEKAGLLYHYSDIKDIKDRTLSILSDPSSRVKYKRRKDNFIKSKIDLTSFLIWFIENYPHSPEFIRNNENFQSEFL